MEVPYELIKRLMKIIIRVNSYFNYTIIIVVFTIFVTIYPFP